jgi:protein TonB
VDELPEAIAKVAPEYPDSAREHGVDGTVIVNALVCASGTIIDAYIAKSIPDLDDAAERAVRQWIFHPAMTDGLPVAVWVVIPVRFTIHLAHAPSSVRTATPRSSSAHPWTRLRSSR